MDNLAGRRGSDDDEDDQDEPWGEASLLLRDLHRYLRHRADQKIRNVEALVILRFRGLPHGKCREMLKLTPEEYRNVNRWAREGVAAITLAPKLPE